MKPELYFFSILLAPLVLGKGQKLSSLDECYKQCAKECAPPTPFTLIPPTPPPTPSPTRTLPPFHPQAVQIVMKESGGNRKPPTFSGYNFNFSFVDEATKKPDIFLSLNISTHVSSDGFKEDVSQYLLNPATFTVSWKKIMFNVVIAHVQEYSPKGTRTPFDVNGTFNVSDVVLKLTYVDEKPKSCVASYGQAEIELERFVWELVRHQGKPLMDLFRPTLNSIFCRRLPPTIEFPKPPTLTPEQMRDLSKHVDLSNALYIDYSEIALACPISATNDHCSINLQGVVRHQDYILPDPYPDIKSPLNTCPRPSDEKPISIFVSPLMMKSLWRQVLRFDLLKITGEDLGDIMKDEIFARLKEKMEKTPGKKGVLKYSIMPTPNYEPIFQCNDKNACKGLVSFLSLNELLVDGKVVETATTTYKTNCTTTINLNVKTGTGLNHETHQTEWYILIVGTMVDYGKYDCMTEGGNDTKAKKLFKSGAGDGDKGELGDLFKKIIQKIMKKPLALGLKIIYPGHTKKPLSEVKLQTKPDHLCISGKN